MKIGDRIKYTSIVGAREGRIIELFVDARPECCTLLAKDDEDKLFYCNLDSIVLVCEGDPPEIVKEERKLDKCPDALLFDVTPSDETF